MFKKMMSSCFLILMAIGNGALVNGALVNGALINIALIGVAKSAPLYTVSNEMMEADKPAPKSIAVKAMTNPEVDKQAVREVILRMNRAVTARNLDALKSTLAEQAIKVDLFPAHYKKTTNKPQIKSAGKKIKKNTYPRTASLLTRWQAVLGIMQASTQLYERKVRDISVQLNGAMATAWVHIQTRTVSHDVNQPESQNAFYEMVLLKKIAGQWTIMLTSNNRHDR